MNRLFRSCILFTTLCGWFVHEACAREEPLLIAVVDDAFRLTHEALAPFIWSNPREIPGNRVDDDGNGFVDDVSGWDLADGDADVTPPPGREAEFYHGTHMAGIIIEVVRQFLGDEAPRRIRILPVKGLGDETEKPYLKSGYKGIQYALDVGADIILTAWSVSTLDANERRILQEAEDRGCLVIASAGNMFGEVRQYPASFPSVVSVAACDDSGVRIPKSSYGGFVDLVARGKAIKGPSSSSDTGFESHSGTSQAAAIVAGATAVLKLKHPQAGPDEIMALMKNTAVPVEDRQNGELFFGGKLGAGMLHLKAALAYNLEGQPDQANYTLRTHQGYLARYRPQDNLVIWRMRPEGNVNGFWFEPKKLEGDPGTARMQLFQPGLQNPFLDLALSDWQERLYVPGDQAMALLVPDPEHPDFQLLVEFASEPINQATLFCEGTAAVVDEGILSDGSGEEDYSPQSDCKWLISAPPGKAIRIEFLEFDTEANTDWLYFFNGAGTHGQIMAVYSGAKLPPALTSWSNQVLLWFVTDERNQGKGWKAEVSFVDPEPPEEAKNETPKKDPL